MNLAPLLGVALQIRIAVGEVDTRLPTAVRDSGPPAAKPTAPFRRAITADVLATAFRDEEARLLLTRARRVRVAHDSVIRNYEGSTFQRMSVWAALTDFSRERLAYRHETNVTVRWQRDRGAWLDVTASRAITPGVPELDIEAVRSNPTGLISPVPYFPGHEALWVGPAAAQPQVNDREMVNPLAEGAEAYYTYATGDSTAIDVSGRSVALRELVVRPRIAAWNVIIGSLWFDRASDQLVRAVFRSSAELDYHIDMYNEWNGNGSAGFALNSIATPLTAKINLVSIEYGLVDGTYWLPRVRVAEGEARALFVRAPMRIEQKFSYASINGPDTVPTIRVVGSNGRFSGSYNTDNPSGLALTPRQRRVWSDSLRSVYENRPDSLGGPVPRRLIPDSRLLFGNCEPGGTWTRYRFDRDGIGAIGVRTPCDVGSVVFSNALARSIYEDADTAFADIERDPMVRHALSMRTQAPITGAVTPLAVRYGLAMTRYNRVEGLSTGVRVEQSIGGGYSLLAMPRYGFGDQRLSFEVGARQTDLTTTIGATIYNRLMPATDWGHPLNFGSSLAAAFFGRDEAYYYRASGAELTYGIDHGHGLRQEWRGFVEDQHTADRSTIHGVSGPNFADNIMADELRMIGGSYRLAHTLGLDPTAPRLFTDARVEVGAADDGRYSRAAINLTGTSPISSGLAASLNVAGGTSIGRVPRQRLWYLGGSKTVRGQSLDPAQSGTMFWLTRFELGDDRPELRTIVFGDIGWTGNASQLRETSRQLRGIGVGWSFADGLARFDIAWGLQPRRQWRLDFSLESPF